MWCRAASAWSVVTLCIYSFLRWLVFAFISKVNIIAGQVGNFVGTLRVVVVKMLMQRYGVQTMHRIVISSVWRMQSRSVNIIHSANAVCVNVLWCGGRRVEGGRGISKKIRWFIVVSHFIVVCAIALRNRAVSYLYGAHRVTRKILRDWRIFHLQWPFYSTQCAMSAGWEFSMAMLFWYGLLWPMFITRANISHDFLILSDVSHWTFLFFFYFSHICRCRQRQFLLSRSILLLFRHDAREFFCGVVCAFSVPHWK